MSRPSVDLRPHHSSCCLHVDQPKMPAVLLYPGRSGTDPSDRSRWWKCQCGWRCSSTNATKHASYCLSGSAASSCQVRMAHNSPARSPHVSAAPLCCLPAHAGASRHAATFFLQLTAHTVVVAMHILCSRAATTALTHAVHTLCLLPASPNTPTHRVDRAGAQQPGRVQPTALLLHGAGLLAAGARQGLLCQQ